MTETEKPNILVVDDKETNLLVSQKILEDCDANIITARDGNEALKLVLNHEFAVIILDVKMPGMDGKEAATIIRTETQTPIIFQTASVSDRKSILQGYDIGAVDYLIKPLEPEILRSKVDIFLQLYNQQKQLKKHEKQLEKMVNDLQKSLATIKTLEGIIPICASCKKIRDDKGYWNQVETYIRARTDAEFTHSICPDCTKKLYPELYGDGN